MNEEKITAQAREMYSDYRFGHFNYAAQRAATEPMLMEYVVLAAEKNLKIFDIGCGVGFWADVYLSQGVKQDNITLLDLSRDNVDELKKRGYQAECGSVLNLPFDDNISDFTICSGVIHHTDNPFKAFSELVRITKPGGLIYLNVYNAYNPYFYIVHRATYPIRFLYWRGHKWIAEIFFPLAKLVAQPCSLIVFRKLLDESTARVLFMDQVITPRAYLFTKRKIRKYAESWGASVEKIQFNKYYLMISSIIKIRSKK